MSSTTSSTYSRPTVALVLLLVLSMFIWGGTWPSGKLVGGVAGLDLTVFARFLVTALSLAVVVAWRREKMALPPRAIPWVVVVAVLMSAYNYLFLGGLHWGLASKGGVIVTCLNPILTFGLSAVVFRRKVGRREWLGLALGVVAGVLLLEVWRLGPGELFRSGNLFFLGAAIAWSTLTVASQSGQRHVGYIAFSLWVYILSAVLNFVVLAVRGLHLEVTNTGLFWGNVLFLGVAATAFGTTVFFLASRRLGAHRAGSYMFLVPGFAMLLSWILLGEIPDWTTLLGLVVAVGAVYLINSATQAPGRVTERAAALNAILDRGPIGGLLSALGRRLSMPRGIVVQAGEATRLARVYNASAGVATRGGEPMHLGAVQRAFADLKPAEVYSYSPTQGNPKLRELWKSRMLEKNPSLAGAETTLPTVVPGLTFGVSATADLFVDPGDVLLVPTPCWDNYEHVFATRHGAVVRGWPLFEGEGLALGALERELAALARARKKAILLLNFPHNPTGYSPTMTEADTLVALLSRAADRGRGIVVILDDAYHGLVYEPGVLRESLFARLAGAHERLLAVKVDGTTKEDLAWGFRVAFLTFASRGLDMAQREALEEKLAGEIRSLVSSSSTPAQSLMLHALEAADYRADKATALAELAARYAKIREVLARVGRPELARPLPFNSGYFLCLELAAGGADEVRRSLLEEGIGTIALEDRLLRIAYSAVDLEGIEPMLTSIYRVLARRGGET